MPENLTQFMLRRSREELAQADTAPNLAARKAHLEIAEIFARRAALLLAKETGGLIDAVGQVWDPPEFVSRQHFRHK